MDLFLLKTSITEGNYRYIERAKKLLGDSWADWLWEEFTQKYFQNISTIVKRERELLTIYPENHQVFRAFNLTPYEKVKVVIVGQDPYHNGQADGLAFSSTRKEIPKSLKNIFKEIETDLGIEVDRTPDLTRWAEQGVFLINTSLTVRAGLAGSHSKIGWDKFIRKVLYSISMSPAPVVFILWGNHAHSFKKYIHQQGHLILTSAHPSPLSAHRGFFGCKHFSKCNDFLIKSGIEPINWK